jgi:hypothetical protein
MESPTVIFEHSAHFSAVAAREELGGLIPGNISCGVCHAAGEPKSTESAKACLECHRKDMTPTREPQDELSLANACGYRQAMHDTCIACHREEQQRMQRPGLAACSHCHPGLRSREWQREDPA